MLGSQGGFSVATQVTVRFYIVHDQEGVPLEDRLAAIAAKPKGTREINTADNEAVPFNVRLEDCDTSDKAFMCGQFVRRTLDNHPPEATEEGLLTLKLKEGAGLGYPAAFAYAPALKVIAIEHSPRTLSLSRILLYVNMMGDAGKLSAQPIPNQLAWDRYKTGKPRKITLTIANPTNLAAVEGEVGGVLSASGKLNEIFEGPVITIEVSMGHKKGFLNPLHVEKILNYFTKGEGKGADVRSLKASVKPDDGSPTDELDFLNELLVSRDTLELSGDPLKDYARRKAFVLAELKSHTPYLKKVYGPANA